MSFFIISDGKTFKKFGSAQDHKRVLEGDKGKNTGGMVLILLLDLKMSYLIKKSSKK